MTNNETLINDLDYAAKIAREGANTPLLGGPFFLIWSSLLIPTLFIHGAVISQLLPMAAGKIGLLWLAYGVTGLVLSTLVSKRRSSKSGCNTFLNRLSRISGISVSVILFSFAIGMTIATNMGELSYQSYNLILPFAFGLQAFHLTMLGNLSGKKYLQRAAYIAGLTMLITLVFNGKTEIYFVSALSIFFCMALPGYIEMRDEERHVSR